MPETWKHPELGEFTGGSAWTATLSIPEFKTFSYAPRGGSPPGECRLSFLKPIFGFGAAGTNSGPPSQEAVRVARKVLDNQKQLATAMARALWEEFHGRGPTSRMWWDGKIDEIRERAREAKVPALDGPDDVRALLKPTGVQIGPFAFPDPTVLAQVTCSAAFDEEHGVAFLTDGTNILGTGYMSDGARPYEDRGTPRPGGSR